MLVEDLDIWPNIAKIGNREERQQREEDWSMEREGNIEQLNNLKEEENLESIDQIFTTNLMYQLKKYKLMYQNQREVRRKQK